MKKIKVSIFTAVCILYSMVAFAQLAHTTKASATSSLEGSSISYNLPQTSIVVDVVVQREVIKKGPYARFAQKYLGVIAPLSDKEFYAIKGASLSYTQESDPSATYIINNPDKSQAKLFAQTIEGMMQPNAGILRFNEQSQGITPFVNASVINNTSSQSDTSFMKVPIDKVSSIDQSLEDMAAQAANTLFTLRKRRFDLVTGEAGENVYGSGLSAAIEEMKRMEEEYLSLFLGKHFTEQFVRSYEIVPNAAKTTIIVCRFSDTKGLLAETDLSGRPIVMELTPENKSQKTVLPQKEPKDKRGSAFYRVADIVKCKLVDGSSVIISERIPIYQYGSIVEIPISSLK